MDLAYCSNCRSAHLPGEHDKRPRSSGGRHLATAPRRWQRLAKTMPSATAPFARVIAGRTLEAGREVGAWLAHSAERVAFEGKRAARAAGRTLGQGWNKAVEFSGVLDVTSQPPRSIGKHAPSQTPVQQPVETMVAVTPGGVGLVEYSITHDHLLEVSMLESLGFYDPTTVVVAVSAPKAATLSQPANQTTASKAPLIPDLDLVGWKPHVIARSKLNPGNFRFTTVGLVAVATVIVVTLVLAVIRAPQVSETRLHQGVAAQATALQTALTSLDQALGSGDGADAAATTALVDVDIASRGLFEAASRLDANTDQVMRTAAISVAERSLDLESRITQALSYRLVLGPVWRSPDLSAITNPAEAAETLAPWQAQISDLAASLPDSDLLVAHASDVAIFINEIDAWATTYFDALAVEDTNAVTTALQTLESRLAGLAHSAEAVVARVIVDAHSESRLLVSELVGLAG